MTTSELASFLAAIAVILALAHLLGHLARRLGQPAVIGEIIAGILLGPTLLGTLAPELHRQLFPASLHFQAAFEALATLSMCLLMVVAGMEVDLARIRREGAKSAIIGIIGMTLLFSLSLGLAYRSPRFWGSGNIPPHVFAIFFASAIAICALPVIVRILTDLGIYKSDLGMRVVSVAVLNDLCGWFLFSVVMALAGHGTRTRSPLLTILLTLGFVGFSFTAGRRLIQGMLPRVQKSLPGPGGVLTFVVVISLASAALTEWLGVHAVLGAFLAGVLFSDAPQLDERTREISEQFIFNILAPIFFASIGFHADFVADFRGGLILAVLVLAILGKAVSFSIGTHAAGLRPPESYAMIIALLPRGIMGIIFSLVGLEAGFISRELFVALTVMALVTSIISGPLLSATLKLRPRHG